MPSAPESARSESNPNLLNRLSPEDRPRERLLRLGGGALSDAELLAVLLRTGTPGTSAIELGQEVLTEQGGLSGLLMADGVALKRRGLGEAKAATLLAAIELSRRIARTRVPRRNLLDRPDLVANYLSLRYAQLDQEVMGALYLDVRQRLIAERDIYRGTVSRAAVEPRVILKEGLLRSASSFILFHTHPSGDPSPSVEDLSFTRRLSEAGDLVGIRLADHLILGSSGRWISLGRRGAW
ncbi:MAG: DNA repair protein RadC [Acidobacteriota bacterium]